ncbi:MAG: hypothetical protein V1911_03645 [Candidatus Micrarchaeota archaeon]
MVRKENRTRMQRFRDWRIRADDEVSRRDAENIDYLAGQVKDYVSKGAVILGVDNSARMTVFGLKEALKLRGVNSGRQHFINYSRYKLGAEGRILAKPVETGEHIGHLVKRLKKDYKDILGNKPKILVVDSLAYGGGSISNVKKALEIAFPKAQIKTAVLEIAGNAENRAAVDFAAAKTKSIMDFGKLSAPITDKVVEYRKNGEKRYYTVTEKMPQNYSFMKGIPGYAFSREEYSRKRKNLLAGLRWLHSARKGTQYRHL